MSAPIPLRDYVVGGLVTVETVNALLAFGEPMLNEMEHSPGWYRAWIRRRSGGRGFGQPDMTPQLAAERLLEKLRGAR